MSSIIDEIKLKIIFICHLIVVLFVTLTPFSNSNYFLFMHSIIVPFIMMHWVSNNDTCALTLVEKELRKRLNKDYTHNDCFTCKIIEPIYHFKNNNKNRANTIYGITTILWSISLFKLYNRYKCGKISSIRDLFII